MLNRTGKTAVCAVAASMFAAPAQASDARINVSAHVPTRCEMEFVPSVSQSGVTLSLGTVRQYCNTRFQLRFNHAPLSVGAVLGLGDATATANGSSTLIEPDGAPTIAATNLWLSSEAQEDAAIFVDSVVIEVTPVGF